MPLPNGPAVTFLFTDFEGSTRLEQGVGRAIAAAHWPGTTEVRVRMGAAGCAKVVRRSIEQVLAAPAPWADPADDLRGSG